MEYCNECGVKSVSLSVGPGRTYMYRRGFSFDIPSDFKIPTCSSCSAMYINGEIEFKLRRHLRDVHDKYQSDLVTLLLANLESYGHSVRSVERACGVVPTYFSFVIRGKANISETELALLRMYEKYPEGIYEYVEGKI